MLLLLSRTGLTPGIYEKRLMEMRMLGRKLLPSVRATYFQFTILNLSSPPMSFESFCIVMSLAKIFARAFLKDKFGGSSA